MISIFSRLYRTDDDLFLCDMQSSDCFVIYDINETQPYLPKAQLIDPNMTRAYIDSAKMVGNRKKVWMNLDGGQLYKILAAIAIGGGLLYAFLINGGL